MIARASKHSVVATHTGGEAFDVAVRDHRIRTDQPRTAGGSDSAPTPLELMGVSLASCVALYVHRFCLANGLDGRGMAVEVNPLWRADPGRIARFDVLLHLAAGFPEHLGEELMAVAKSCPVHLTLGGGCEISVKTVSAPKVRRVREGTAQRPELAPAEL